MIKVNTPEQIQDIPQVQSIQQVPVEPKKKSNLLKIVILLIVILLVGAGYIYGKKYLNKPKACTSEALVCPDGSSVGRTGLNCEFAPCPTKTETQAVDEKANWKTYVNNSNMFTFRYPNYLEETKGDWNIYFRNISNKEFVINSILVTVGNKNTNETLDEFVDKNVLISTYKSVDPFNPIPTPSPYKLVPLARESIIVDNQKAIWLEGSFDPSVDHIYVFVPNKSTSYIRFEFFEGTGGRTDQEIKQILSTFKFTN